MRAFRPSPNISLFAALTVILAALWGSVLLRTDGRGALTLDDGYIQLACARTLVESGTWGVNDGEFASATSSPLWVVALATVTRPFVDRMWCGVVLAAACLFACAWGIVRLLAPSYSAWRRAVLAFGICLAGPLPPLVFTGLEHVAHTFLVLMLISIVLDARGSKGWSSTLAVVGVGLRLETLFVLAALVLVSWRSPRRGRAWIALAAGIAAVVGYGAWAVSNGAGPLPNAFLTRVPTLSGTPANALTAIATTVMYTPHLTLLIAVGAGALATSRFRRDASTSIRAWLAVFVVAASMHLVFAQTGWFYRYEAYLMVIGLVALARGWTVPSFPRPAVTPRGVAWATLLMLTGLFVGKRTVGAMVRTPIAAANIFEQHVRIADFLTEYRGTDSILVNDVGAVAWRSHVRVVDLAGLASQAITPVVRAHARAGRPLPGSVVDSIAVAEHASVAVIYNNPEWWGPLPAPWIVVDRWTIDDNFVCALDTVTFLARGDVAAERLAAELDAFAETR